MKYKTLCDMTLDNEKTLKIKVIPKGTILTEVPDYGMYESKDPQMCIGNAWMKKNPHVFEEIK